MEITLILDRDDVGQILDGLSCRAESYRNTERYYNGEFVEDGIEDVSDADEARNLAEYYERLIESIRMQRNEQIG